MDGSGGCQQQGGGSLPGRGGQYKSSGEHGSGRAAIQALAL